MSLNLIEILNTIRDNASAQYQDRIPEATAENCDELRYAMLDGNNVVCANEFTSSLLNHCIAMDLISKIFENPLKPHKKGIKPIGDTVQEVYNNFMKGTEYDPEGINLLKRELPDVKAVYHRMNYKQKYKVTISREQLSKAFKSYENLEIFINGIINSLYNSAELDEFINMKQMLKSAREKNAMKVIEIPDPVESKANAEEFIKTVKTVSGLMKFPSDEYNGYLTAQSVDKTPIITFSRPEEQILILDTATNVSVSVDVLAQIFNMSVAEFNETRKVVIDHFPDPTMRAALVDEAFFQMYDDLVTVKRFENGEGLYDNYFLHVWQTQAYSILVNAVAFVVTSNEHTITYELPSYAEYEGQPTKVKHGESVTIQIQYNDSPAQYDVAYMNGVEVARVNCCDAIVIENVTGDIVIRNES